MGASFTTDQTKPIETESRERCASQSSISNKKFGGHRPKDVNTAYSAAERKRIVMKPKSPMHLSDRERQEFLVYFRKFDKDKDDALSFQEVRDFFKHLGILTSREEARDIFLKTDLNGSGKIEFEEFLQAFVLQKQGVSKEKLEQVFNTFDKNGDGVMTREELQGGLIKLGTFLSQEAFSAIWDALDKNSDDRVTVKEFLKFVRKP